MNIFRRMIALIILSIAIAGTFGTVIPFHMSSIPEEYKEFIPQELKDFLKDLTPEDKQILRNMTINHHQYANEDAALEALKEKSEKLHAKVHALIDFVKKKLESLTPDAKKFADEVIAKARSLRPEPGSKPDLEKIKESIREFVEKYKALSDETKENLKTTFPNTAKIISSK
ncbi:unnamed protein product [Dracunculus medinensis]|uniref:Fatty-acid and retinol-binding protein 1 n=1 Tax=Dracunculus medinensis TaxID=318479 RepID=A0A3P7TEV8_DRAME|nr:unnamed protein product [Dracunculus medinensis]